MSRAVVAALALAAPLGAGCGIDLGPAGEWVPADEISGALAPVSGELPGRARAPAVSGPTRIVTFNVEYGEDPVGLATAIAGDPELTDAAVILVQEIEAYPDEPAPRAQVLADRLGYRWTYVPARIQGAGTHGLAILSRYPIANVEVMTLGETGGDHPRIAVGADILIGDVVLHVIDVHLGTKLNIRDRILQLRPVVLDAPGPVLVGGDFNTSPYLWSEEAIPLVPTAQIVDTDQAPLLDDYMRDIGYGTPAAGVGPTEHKLGVEARLDAFYTRGLPTGAVGVERSVAGSDHWPLWIDLAP